MGHYGYLCKLSIVSVVTTVKTGVSACGAGWFASFSLTFTSYVSREIFFLILSIESAETVDGDLDFMNRYYCACLDSMNRYYCACLDSMDRYYCACLDYMNRYYCACLDSMNRYYCAYFRGPGCQVVCTQDRNNLSRDISCAVTYVNKEGGVELAT